MAATAGYSGTPLPTKLGIKAGTRFAVRHAPDGLAAALGELPDGAQQGSRRAGLDVVIAFHTVATDLTSEWPALTSAVAPSGAVWVAWPNKAAKVPTDITENVLRELLLPTGWVDDKVCAIDDRWSGLRSPLRRRLR